VRFLPVVLRRRLRRGLREVLIFVFEKGIEEGNCQLWSID
jgi:hypothetical protein